MKLPDLAKSFTLFKISAELEVCKGDSIFAHSIRNGLREKNNLLPVIKMILDQAKDNRGLVEHIVGVDLLRKIESLSLNQNDAE